MRETEIDGVQTLLVPAGGPLRAGLTFRVGLADETLPYTGVTHLVEHLVLPDQEPHGYRADRMVTTSFDVEGSADDVVAFLDRVCRSLADLPMAQLDTQKSELRAERAERSPDPAAELAPWRYGARSYGLLGFDEFGLHRLTAEDVREWAASEFTRENAVLWLAGDGVPAGLRLRLPSGARRPPPQAYPILRQTPAYCTGDVPGVALDAVVRRGVPATTYAAILNRELFVSSEAGARFEPRDHEYGTILARHGTLDGLLDVLTRHRLGRIDQAQLDRCRTEFTEALDHPDRVAATLPRAAFNALVGFPNRTDDELRDRLRELTLDDVHRVARDTADGALLMLSSGSDTEPDGFVPAHHHSTDSVRGQRFRPLTADGRTLIVGEDGVSLVVNEELTITVPYAECEGMMCWPDGRRWLFHRNADNIAVEPGGYESGAQAVALIDAAVPAAVHIPMRARRPAATARPDWRGREPGQRLSRTAGTRLAGVGAFGAVMLVAGLLRPDDRALYLASGTVLVLLAGYGFWWWTRGPRAR